MEMDLGVGQRLMLLQILPREGDITTIRIIKELREQLSFTEEDHRRLQIRQEGGVVFWNVKEEYFKEVKIGDVAVGLVVKSLKQLSDNKKLTEGHLPLWEMFMGGH